MRTTAYQTITITAEQLGSHVMVVEWLVKQQHQLSLQQKQIKQQQQQIAEQQQEIEQLVGWLSYGGNLTWRKQEHFIEYVFGIPISQGSLAKMHKWFAESLEPVMKEWLKYIQQPGIRCVDETTYCIDGIKYWVWVATSHEVCVLMLAPTRSSAEIEKLLGADFQGILSSDCYGAYFRQSASAKQKCLAHLERELESLKNSRFEGNRQFAQDVLAVLEKARTAHYHHHTGILKIEQLASIRTEVESQLEEIFEVIPQKGWPDDAIRLINRLKRHWDEWFTFLTIPEVKPDNNDAERALRPIVIHRKVSGGARSDWGAQLVTQMFSFLETLSVIP